MANLFDEFAPCAGLRAFPRLKGACGELQEIATYRMAILSNHQQTAVVQARYNDHGPWVFDAVFGDSVAIGKLQVLLEEVHVAPAADGLRVDDFEWICQSVVLREPSSGVW